MNTWTKLFSLTFWISNVCGSKILVVFPYPGTSHSLLGEGYVRHLLRAGHEVTYITPRLIKEPHPKLRQIDVSSNVPKFALAPMLDIGKIMSKEVDFGNVDELFWKMFNVGNLSIMHENVQNFIMDTNETFDLVISEWLLTELYCGFAAVFNCPYIWVSPLEPQSVMISLIDDFSSPAISPVFLTASVPPLSFTERVIELKNLISVFWTRWNLEPHEEIVFKDAFGPAVTKRGLTLPTLEELKYNASVVLGNSHVTSGVPMRLPPNFIHISGFHIEEKVPPLPENLKQIMDNAPHGVIYFSMGTMVKSETMPVKMKRDILKVFGELKQEVIWKFEEKLTDLPKNVHIVQWSPQQSILAHPNCLFFISHGGLLSTTEGLYYGKPIIGIPVFADQFNNILRAAKKGFAIHVPLGHDTPDLLRSAIQEMLNNPKYQDTMKIYSFVYHHRTAKPGDELNHWVEHVIKTNGALHLRTPALLTPFYQKYYLDLLAIIVVTIIVVLKIVKYCISPKTKSNLKKKNK